MTVLAKRPLRKPGRPGAVRQRGAALLVALMILLITAMLGMAAMRTSIFNSRIALSTQVDAMAFEAAESALSVAFREIGSSAGMTDMLDMLDGGIYERCVTAAVPLKPGACAGNDYMDSSQMIRAHARAAVRGRHPISGGQISTTGGNAILVDYEVGILGESEVMTFEMENHHAQEALKRGLMAGFEVQ